ncbi:MAG TPA: beta-ketoacyl synthase N-terminal-like domain-containing protein, partial [Chloroflexota bacterium]|nr:beta-ketoacyl synthase N-terminal-like domain-containing protein [Chloroflexota bacterium]
SLARHETDYALAGAVGLTLHHGKWVYFSKAGMLSVDGRCKTFDAGANGYVPGEGIAAVLLKRLDDALRDRDTIHGVIRGIAVNQDGRTNGITAPSPRAQRDLCQEVYERFGIDPSTISYVEAHGTGTPLGDPIEVSALSQAFSQFTDRKQFCGIGSLKTNIGHLEPVAGVAGLTKVLLAMKHRQLPPTIHFNEVNPHIHFEETPFYLVDRLQEWKSDGPRRATISAFSFGGVNAHLVVEEPPATVRSLAGAPDRSPEVITLAATSDTALASMAARLDAHLATEPGLSFADVAFTLNVGRDHFDRRLAFVAESMEELRQELGRASERIGSAERAEGQRRRRKARQGAFAFGGDASGAQAAARMLAGAEPEARALFDQAEGLVGALSPAATLYVFQVALARLWEAWGLKVQAVAGEGDHALAAAVARGALSFEDGLRQAQAGAWSVAESEDATVPLLPLDQLTAEEYVLVPIEPGASSRRRLAEIAAEAYQAGLDLDWLAWHRQNTAGRVPLPTYPFERQHIPPPPRDPLADPASADEVPAALRTVGQTEPTALEKLNGTQPHTVRVEPTNGTAANGRYTLVLEDQDGRVLARLPDVSLAGNLGALAGAANDIVSHRELEPLPEGLLHELRWQPRSLTAAGTVPVGTYVLFANDRVAEHVERSLAAGGSRVIRVLPGPEFAEEGPDLFRVNPGSPGDHDGLVVALQERGVEPIFVHLWSCGERQDALSDPDVLESHLARGSYSVFALIRAISRRRLGGPPALFVGSTDAIAVGGGPIQPERSAVFGLMRTIGQEYAQLRTVHVDLSVDDRPEALAASLLGEIAGGQADRSVAYRGEQRFVPELAPLEVTLSAAGPRLRERGVYWITGGLGGLGRLVARHLAERFHARLVLCGRTVPPPRERWDAYLASAAEDDAMAHVIRDIQAIEAAGG